MLKKVLGKFLSALLVVGGLTPLWAAKINLKPNHKYICYVAKVSDGDTIQCRFPYDLTHEVNTVPIRLIGIDTPETGVRKKNTGKQEREIEKIYDRYLDKDIDISRQDVVKLGIAAKRFTERLLANVYVVTIETDVDPTDHYGRVLAYVWLPDGRMLNKEIICNGYALLLTVPPNVKYQDIFRDCFRKAVEEKKGLWGAFED